MEGVFMNKSYEEIVTLVRDTLVEAGSTFRQDKKDAYKRAIEAETNRSTVKQQTIKQP